MNKYKDIKTFEEEYGKIGTENRNKMKRVPKCSFEMLKEARKEANLTQEQLCISPN